MLVSPLAASTAVATPPMPSGPDGPGPTERERLRATMKRTLRKRVATLSGKVLGPTPGVETEQAGGGEVAALLARYWSGTAGGFDRENCDETDGERLTEALSAPEYEFGDDGYVRVGRQYARTYWVADWPAHPPASFLRELVTKRGVDVDVTVRFKHRTATTREPA